MTIPTQIPNNQRNNFGFPSEKTPPQNKDLIPFENDMYKLIKTTQFKRPNVSQFQQALKRDINKISSSNKIYVPADKTTNMYKLSSKRYQKLLAENITATYKKSSDNTKANIDMEAKNIANKLKIADRVESFARRESFITLKDHKENFANNPKCRLINPAKSEIGLISKQHLEKIVAEVQHQTQVNQWRNTNSVIQWFSSIPQKKRCRFFQFDVVEFYPSISQELLTKSINFARKFTEINDDVYEIIMHVRKSLLFSKDSVWIKKSDS